MSSYDISFKYRFEAAHRFTKSCADSCATPHGHTWFATAVFEAPARSLGPDEMVVEFSQVKRAWKSFLQNTVDHSFMHHYEDPILSALRSAIPQFRGLPFPGDPTTELIAALFFAKLERMNTYVDRGLVAKAVVIRETPTNSVTFRKGPEQTLIQSFDARFEGWWNSDDPNSRVLETKR